MIRCFAIAAAFSVFSASAQGQLVLSLQQALDLAAKQSYAVRTSAIEAEKARRRIEEVAAIGLPQVNVDAGIQNYIDVPISVVPNFFGPGPELLEAQFGLPWTTNAKVQLDQLIFDGSYLVGLKATRELRQQSDQELQLAVRDAKAAAANAYYGWLAADEGTKAMEDIIPVLERSLNEAIAMQENGFMEETDSDRIRIELTNASDQLVQFQSQRTLAMDLLRFYLGIQDDTPVELSDELERLIEDPAEIGLLEQPLELASHVEHRIASSQVRIQDLNVRNEKAAYLPKLSGFFSYQRQSFGVDNVVDTDWYPATLWGLGLRLPIFSSGMRASKVAQAKLLMEQVDLNLAVVTQQLRLQEAQARNDARTALLLYRTQKERLELARKVMTRTSTKFTEGLASSFELTNGQADLLQEQQTYIQRLADLVKARTQLRKTLDLY